MDIYFNNDQLILEGIYIDFPHCIKNIKLYKDLVLVLLSVPKGIINNQNVYAVNIKTKKIVWRIQEPDLIYDSNPYMNFYDSSECIVVGNWNGISYTINEDDGSRIQGIQAK